MEKIDSTLYPPHILSEEEIDKIERQKVKEKVNEIVDWINAVEKGEKVWSLFQSIKTN